MGKFTLPMISTTRSKKSPTVKLTILHSGGGFPPHAIWKTLLFMNEEVKRVLTLAPMISIRSAKN